MNTPETKPIEPSIGPSEASQRAFDARQRSEAKLQTVRTATAYHWPRLFVSVFAYASVAISAIFLLVGVIKLGESGHTGPFAWWPFFSIPSALLTRWLLITLFDLADLKLSASQD